jgi:flagellar biosynthesis/type III secretory pathway protein FliH
MRVEADAERIAAIEAEAYERGRSEARLEADRLEAVCSTLEAAAAELAERADREDVAWRELVLGLSMSIARRWIGRELKSEPEAFMAMLGRALERLPEPRVARLCLASETLARLDEQRPQWRDVLSSGRTLDIEADPGLDASEYRIEGSEGVVDGRVAVLLADLEAVLSDSLGDTAEEGA